MERFISTFFARAMCAILVLALLTPLSAAQAVIAPAGGLILNRAETTFFNPRLGIVERIYSNQVEALVLEVPSIEVLGFSDLRLSRGARDQHYFEVRNVGNTPLEVSMAMLADKENGLMHNQRLVLDQNGDGRVDDNEPVIGAAESLFLEMGESLRMIYVFEVTTTAPLNATMASFMQVSAVSPSGAAIAPVSADGQGLVTIVEAGLEIEKSQSLRQMNDGYELAYNLRLRNNSEAVINGYDTVDGDKILIDGNEVSGILVRDEIPLNTVFAMFDKTSVFTPLFHVQDDPAQQYVSEAPADFASVDAIAFFLSGDYPVGRANDLSFRVKLADDLGPVTVRNIATTFVPGADGASPLQSNEVVFLSNAASNAALEFIDPALGAPIEIAALDDDATLRVTGGACNLSSEVDVVAITVTSKLTNDTETVSGVETGPNTGVFLTAPLPLAQMASPLTEDGVLATIAGDALTSLAICGGQVLNDGVAVNPGSFVFNSVNNHPVADVVVHLVNANGERVATGETDARGYFAVGAAPAGRYRFEVEAPAAFAFPSVRLAFPGMARSTGSQFSYGRMFSHPGGPVFATDIPLDPFYGVPLTLSKTTEKSSVRTGEFVTYTLKARNNMDEALVTSQIIDRIPSGTSFVLGTAFVDGRKIADPVIDGSRDHTFDLGVIEPLDEVTFSYTLRFTAFVKAGDVSNTAVLSGFQAGTGTVRTSNIARATIRMDDDGGVFSREGTVMGSVYLDCNENGVRDGKDEMGVPGVKIVTQEGLSVVTDINGNYSLFALRPVSHVFSLMKTTLPDNAKPHSTKTFGMGRAGTRLVPVKRGEVRSEHFALSTCTSEILDDVTARREAFADRDLSASQLLSDLPMQSSRPDGRSSRSEAGLATSTQIYGSNTQNQVIEQDLTLKAEQAALDRQTLESQMRSFSSDPAFINLKDGAQVKRATISVNVKGPADLTMGLLLNGEPIAAKKIGERSVWEKGNVQALGYVAIELAPGANVLKLVGKDPFGIQRVGEEITITAPGKASQLAITVPDTAPATPGTPVPVVVRLLDASGTPVEASATVTLNSRLGVWDVADIRQDKPGIQAFIDNGEATFDLLAPQVSGEETIEVTSSIGQAEATFTFLPDLNERILVGVIEGAVALGGRGDLIETDRISPFEDTATGVRGEVYLKGRIRGDALLTLRYSSDRDTDDRLFRDVRGDEYYPVYGDNSERGHDAQSSTNLYVKIEKGRSYVLYGDVAIEPEAQEFRLGGYSRLTAGAKAGWKDENVSVSVFAAHTAQSQRVVEFSGRGVTGPYDVDLSDFREGSDIVEVIVRDEITGAIISERSLRHLTDYILNFFANTIVFDTPIRQTDRDGNPISIRMTFETDSEDAGMHWIYGAEANYQMTEKVRVGVRAVHVDAARLTRDRERIRAAYLQAELTETTTFEVEAAHSENGISESGAAIRALMRHKTDERSMEVEISSTASDFTATGSSLGQGQDRLRADYTQALSDRDSVAVSAAHVRDRVNNSERTSADVAYQRAISDEWSSRLGYRVERVKTAGETTTDLFGATGFTWRPSALPALQLDLQYDVPLNLSNKGILTMGLDYEFQPGWTIVADAELEMDGHGGMRHSNRLLFGLEYDATSWLKGSTQYEAMGRNGSQARVVQGFDGEYDLSEQIKLSFGAEHSVPLDNQGESVTSVTFGPRWESANKAWVADSDVEVTFEDRGRTLSTNVGVAGKVSEDLTLLARSRFARDDRGDGPSHLRHRARVGFAYRPVVNPRFEMLGWYENRFEKQALRNMEHVWSLASTYEVDEDLRVNGKYAGQLSLIDFGGASASTLTQLLQAGASVDVLDDRLVVGVNAMRLWDDQGGAINAVGVELGVVPVAGSMISIGYNKSRGRAGSAATLYQEGVYMRLRLMLDDSLWDQLERFGIL